MNAALRVRPATAADIPELVSLVNRAYRGDAATSGWTTETHLLDGPRTDAADVQQLLQGEGTILACRTAAEDALVGSVYLQPQAGRLYVGMLAVAPERQATGIGKYLLQAAEAYARQHQCHALVMTVLSERPELLAWYQRHGFQPTGHTEPFPEETHFGTPRQALTLVELSKELPEPLEQ